jgi:hypothetical protein
MKPPGVFWVSIVFGLSIALPPFLERFYPTAQIWWSYLVLVVLDIAVIAIKITWPKLAKKAVIEGEVGSLNTAAAQMAPAPALKPEKTWKKFVF